MAKKANKKEEILKLTSEELETLQKLQGTINNAAMNLANIEIAKYELLQDHALMKKDMQEFSLTLQEKYGEVNISLNDGTISEIEEKTTEMEVIS
tara:strand:- start:504 stop:788 length:285 start_codon:yes stop_codon:yes gene_type:complete